MKIVNILFFILLLMPCLGRTQDKGNVNVGIIPANIWYYPSKFFAGETVKIYTAIFNNSGQDISGIVVFYNNNQEIGQSKVKLSAQEKIKEVSINWEARVGEQIIQAKIVNLKIIQNGEEREINLPDIQVAENKIFIDKDMDGDDIGDKMDENDNDGISDEIEKEQELDPQENETLKAQQKVKEKINDFIQKKEKIKEIAEGNLSLGKIGSAFKVINSYAQEQKIKLEKIKQKKFSPHPLETHLISQHSSSSPATQSHLDWKSKFQDLKSKLYYWSLTIAIFVLKYKVILYLILFFLIYKTLKAVIMFFID